MSRFSNKAVPIVLMCCTVVWIILVIILISNLVQISSYHKVKASISSIDTKLTERGGDSQTSKAHFVTYHFTYDSQPYEVTQQVFTKIGKHIGDVVTLRCNPDNPVQVANMLLIRSCIAGICFLCLFIITVFHQNFRGR